MVDSLSIMMDSLSHTVLLVMLRGFVCPLILLFPRAPFVVFFPPLLSSWKFHPLRRLKLLLFVLETCSLVWSGHSHALKPRPLWSAAGPWVIIQAKSSVSAKLIFFFNPSQASSQPGERRLQRLPGLMSGASLLLTFHIWGSISLTDDPPCSLLTSTSLL